MTSLPRVQIASRPSGSVDLSRDSDLHMCALSLLHNHAPKTTLKYAKMIYYVQNAELKPTTKHGHVYITPSWRVRWEYRFPDAPPSPGDPKKRLRAILLGYLSPASRLCVRVLLSSPSLLGSAP